MSVPYVGFGNETLARQPTAEVGQVVDCPRCGGEHALTGSTTLMFIKCGAASYLAGVSGRLVLGLKSDVAGTVDLESTPAQWSWGEDGASIFAEVDGGERRVASLPIVGERTEANRMARLERAQLLVRAVNAHPALLAAVEATLLFHSGGHWDAAKAARWKDLTGGDDATTRALCDLARAALRKAGA